jgi:hypothetical protein
MRIVLVIAAAVLSGCVSGYDQFYRSSSPDALEQIQSRRASPPPKVPTLEHAAGRMGEIAEAYARHGYAVVGYSAFNTGRRQSDNGALAQAEKAGADLVVIIDPRYTGSITASVPITTPTTSTAYTTGSATAYGPAGTATAFGNATTTTYGSQTSYLPMTVHRYDYGALYLVKTRYAFGARFRDLTDDEHRAIQSNKGVCITIVVEGSPAFKNDVLVGDMIMAIDGQPAYGSRATTELLQANRGRTIELTILRGGTTVTKSVTLLE